MSRIYCTVRRERPETHTKIQATKNGCMPSLLGDGDKGIEVVYGEENMFVLGRPEQRRQNKNLLYRHDKPNEIIKKGLFLLSS
jgi:hypothetical protein